MIDNKFLKILCSIPILLIFLYFIPFLGICLLILRFFLYRRKNHSTPIFLIFAGIVILVPKVAEVVLKMIKMDIAVIPYLEDIINLEIYSKLMGYSKLLICVGVIFLILSFAFRNIANKIDMTIGSYIKGNIEKDAEISRKNDMEIKLKQERAKNTHVIYCPHCGADNVVSGNVGTCKYCRRNITYEKE